MNEGTLLERPLPHSVEIERAILGAIILDNNLVGQVIEFLRPDDFYVQAHKYAFRAIIALSERGEELNPLLIAEELEREGLLERAGGILGISALTDGLPHSNPIASYANLILRKSSYRRIIKFSNKITSEALDEEDDPQVILDNLKDVVATLDEENARSASAGSIPLLTSFATLMNRDFDDGEEVAFHARRGEIALVQSVTNHGKSTLIRNAAIALSTGGEFAPVVERGEPRRVLLLNFEGAGGWFRSDLYVMTRDFLPAEIELVQKNFFPTHAPAYDNEPLSLSRHMRVLERAVRSSGGMDVIIIDTASAAFSIRNENDNAEIANSVMKPLIKLARKLNCLIILVHHVGKAKSEEGVTREQAHRGRGASAWGDFSTSIFNLDADAKDQERATLTCGKRKNGPNYERVLRLRREGRWFEATADTPTKPVTNEDVVLEAMKFTGLNQIPTADIEKAVVGRMSRTTLMNCLNRLADLGKIVSPRRGWWAIIRVCPTCKTPLEGWTSCTKCVESSNPLSDFNLPVDDAAAPCAAAFCEDGNARADL
jgi:hypothetical protein